MWTRVTRASRRALLRREPPAMVPLKARSAMDRARAAVEGPHGPGAARWAPIASLLLGVRDPRASWRRPPAQAAPFPDLPAHVRARPWSVSRSRTPRGHSRSHQRVDSVALIAAPAACRR